MKLNPARPEKIADLTPEYYNQRAEDFWEGPMHAIAGAVNVILVRE